MSEDKCSWDELIESSKTRKEKAVLCFIMEKTAEGELLSVEDIKRYAAEYDKGVME